MMSHQAWNETNSCHHSSTRQQLMSILRIWIFAPKTISKGLVVRNFLVFRFSFTLSVLNATLYFCPITQQNLTNCESWTCEIWSSRKALLLLCFVAHFDDKKCRAFCNFKSHFLTLNQQLFSKSVKGKSILLLNWPRKKYINVHKRIACLVKCEN